MKRFTTVLVYLGVSTAFVALVAEWLAPGFVERAVHDSKEIVLIWLARLSTLLP